MRLELKDYALREDIFGFRNGKVKIMDASAVVSLGFGVGSLWHCGMLLPLNLQHYASFTGLFTCIFIIYVYLLVLRALSLPTALRHPDPKKRIFEICLNFHAFIKICLFWRGGL